jgi:hypothetical protein
VQFTDIQSGSVIGWASTAQAIAERFSKIESDSSLSYSMSHLSFQPSARLRGRSSGELFDRRNRTRSSSPSSQSSGSFTSFGFTGSTVSTRLTLSSSAHDMAIIGEEDSDCAELDKDNYPTSLQNNAEENQACDTIQDSGPRLDIAQGRGDWSQQDEFGATSIDDLEASEPKSLDLSPSLITYRPGSLSHGSSTSPFVLFASNRIFPADTTFCLVPQPNAVFCP